MYFLTILLPLVVAWGRQGHELVAQVAQADLNMTQVANYTGFNGTLSSIANWADEIRIHNHTFDRMHYADVHDADRCVYNATLDCPRRGCIVSAISRFNQQYRNATDFYHRTEALKFLVHLIGDLHQPLHMFGLDHGGNTMDVVYQGHRTSFHRLWDTLLVQNVTLESLNTSMPVNTTSGTLAWAQETALLNCGNGSIWTGIQEGTRINGTYTQSAIRNIRRQLVRAGKRLASVLRTEMVGK